MIKTRPMVHQQQMVDFAGTKPYVGLFADYGVGKTLTALMIIENLRMRKVLVVSTKTSVESTWPEQIREHSNFRFFTMVGARAKKLKLLHRGVRSTYLDASLWHGGRQNVILFLINYDGVKNIIEELADVGFDAIFVDESTKIKDPATLRTKYLWSLGQTCRRRYVMTGFPITEGLHEIYAQVKFLDNGKALGDKYYAFLAKNFVKQGTQLSPKKKSVVEIMEAIRPFCIRITNKDLHLPPKFYNLVEIKKTKQQEQILKDLHDLFRIELGKVKIDLKYIFALISKSLQICDGFVMDKERNIEVIDTEKDDVLVDILEDIDIRRNKVVVWVTHKFSVRKLEILLKKLKMNPLTLFGDTKDTRMVVDRFQHDKKYNVLIASQKKGAESINLTACRYAIYYSHVWSYDNRSNSEARIRRKGSERHKSIIYTDFVTKGTVERNVYSCLRRKSSLVKSLKEQFINMAGEE